MSSKNPNKKGKLLGENRKYIFLSLIILWFFSATLPSKILAINKKPIKLKAVTFEGKNVTFMDAFFMFLKRVNEQAKGKLTITHIGGPEAIPSFEQIEAVKTGIVDLAYLPAAYYVPQMPEVDAIKLSELSPWEERKSGAYDFLNTLHQEKINLYYLGRFTNDIKFHIYLNKKIDKPNLRGEKIRVTPIDKPFVKALGGIPITIAPGEVYTALERGIIDGYGWPSIKISDFGWQEVTKFVVEPGFYQADVGIVFNLKIWNRLPKDIRDLLVAIATRLERDASDYYAKIIQEERDLILSRGMKVIRFSPEDEKKYQEEAYKIGWAHILSKCPETGSKYRELVKKTSTSRS